MTTTDIPRTPRGPQRVVSWVRDGYARWRVVVHEGAKFAATGVFNTLLDFGLFNYLHFGSPGIGPLTAKTISTCVAVTSSYFMNRYWAFRDRGRQGMGKEYTLFFLLNGIGLAIQLACLAIVRYGFGLDSVLALNAAQVAGTGVGMVFRFITYRRWVFPDPIALETEERQ